MTSLLRLLLLLLAACDRVLGLDLPIDAGPPFDAAIPVEDLPWNTPQGDLGISVGKGDDPSLTGDLLQLYWNDDTANPRVLVAERDSPVSPWAPLGEVANIGSAGTPKISPDGLQLLFSSNRSGTLGQMDIMIATRPSRSAMFATPMFVRELNSETHDTSASMSTDGTQMVLSSNRPPGMLLDADIWGSRRAAPGLPWDPPRREDQVSTPATEGSPFLTGDGLTLYFASNRDDGDGRTDRDLYVSRRASLDDAFPPATRIDELSTDESEDDPWVSPDGRHIYFMRGVQPDGTPTPTGLLLHATR